ncbi:hypothetical protein GUITHDRAFT_153994, partial [Guillardia theta CCMP2712]
RGFGARAEVQLRKKLQHRSIVQVRVEKTGLSPTSSSIQPSSFFSQDNVVALVPLRGLELSASEPS